MKTTLRTVINSVRPISVLGQEKTLDIRAKYAIGKIIDAVNREMRDFEKARGSDGFSESDR